MSIAQNFPAVSPSMSMDFANVKKLDPRVTFARASGATYYDGQTVAKAEENLFSYSQEFDNAYWTKNATTVIANSITAPDGTTTADTLSAAGTNLNAILRAILHNSESITFSIYAKEGTKSVLQIDSAQLAGRANFDLATGTLGTVDAAWTASMVNAGNGWYRCVVTFTGTGAAGNFILSMQDSTTAAREATSTAGDLYLWGAQWEVRNAVTAYTPTTTQPITNYIPVLQTAPANVARFDHDPVTGESLGLLVEEQRTNLVTYSEQFDNASWGKSGASVSANQVVAPNGTLTADKIVEDTSTGLHSALHSSVSIVSGTSYTTTVYVKGDGSSRIISIVHRIKSSSNGYIYVDLSNGSVVATGRLDAYSVTALPNGWYKITVTDVANITSGFIAIYILENASETSGNYTGDGYSGIYLWGAQLEAGAFPTSYIKTEASQVTRSADSASMTGANFSDWYRQDEGAFYSEHESVASINQRIYSASDGTNNSAVQGVLTTSGGGGLVFEVRYGNDGVAFVPGTRVPINGQYYKLAGSYAVNNVSAARDGVLGTTDTSANIPVVDRLYIGLGSTGANHINGHIRKLAFYPQRLTNEQLVALTS